MSKKAHYFINSLILYVTILSISMVYLLVVKINEIIETFSVFFMTIFLINLFISIYNIVFLIRKNNNAKDLKMTYLYNLIFCLISGFSIRLLGFILKNSYGLKCSVLFGKKFRRNWNSIDIQTI